PVPRAGCAGSCRRGNRPHGSAGGDQLAAGTPHRVQRADWRAQRATTRRQLGRRRLEPHACAGSVARHRQRSDAAVSLLPLLERPVRRAQSAAGDALPDPHGVHAMKAVALTRYLPIDDPQSLVDADLPQPAPGAHDLLVRVEAQPKVLGYDAAGTVEAVGAEVQGFRPGDRVYYAGDVTRPGSNAEFQLVDARLAAAMPRTLDFAQAAALPLVAVTAWELLFQRIPFDSEHGGKDRSLLVIAGAGGVGSIAIQLARRAGFTVIATASRPETMDWCRAMGAQHVINHREPLAPQLAALGFPQID